MKAHAGILIAGFAVALLATNANAVDYPTRPIKLVVPYAAGGPTDMLGRLIGEYLGRDLKQPVIVENKAGAQGAIGAEAVARSEPDGYTLFVTAASIIVLNPMLYKKLSYDPVRDFRMLALVTDLPVVMEVHPSVPAKNVAEFVAYAKQNPGKINFGSAGTGGTIHLAGEMFKQIAGVDMVHVPYRGGPLALNDLNGGHLDTIIEVYPVVMEQIRSGAIKGLAVSSATRLPSLPDLPTFEEAGVPGIVLTGWLGIYGPPKMPDDVRNKLGEAIVEVVNQPDIQKKFRDIGFEPMIGQGVKEFIAHHEAEVKRWVAFLTELGLRK